MDIAINQITPAEVPALLELILELARFEHLEGEVKVTVESLQDSLFGARPAAGAWLGRCDGELAGYAIYFFTFSSFIGRPGIWLEDVYVRPKFRNCGLGRSLIEAVARVGAERNCARYEWMVLDWNQNALNFYRDLGAQVKAEWVLHRLDEDGLRRLAAGTSKRVSSSRG
ncbi:MAG TPA: GNAT family N-acetyltransferase [Verrucomicrobiae bacterium]|nr:GNAT family N-acetyltransferase [Verrucomicrobiae bacterium]